MKRNLTKCKIYGENDERLSFHKVDEALPL